MLYMNLILGSAGVPRTTKESFPSLRRRLNSFIMRGAPFSLLKKPSNGSMLPLNASLLLEKFCFKPIVPDNVPFISLPSSSTRVSFIFVFSRIILIRTSSKLTDSKLNMGCKSSTDPFDILRLASPLPFINKLPCPL